MGQLRVFRVAIQDELEKAMQIREDVFVKEQNVSPDLEVNAHEGESEHFLAEYDGDPVGTARFRIYGNYFKIERVAVSKKMRGKGVGRALMEEILRIGKKEYPDKIPYIHAQMSAVPFYEKQGWKRIGEEFLDANILHTAMILK